MTFLLALLLLNGPAVEYRATFENAIHHEARIEADFPQLPEGPAHIKISRSSPGRYALHGFAKNVYAVEAFDSTGKELPVERTDSNEWTVTGHDGTVRFRYTLFADRADGTFTAIDTTHYHLSMPATFVWAAGLEDRPIRLRLQKPDKWKIATQLELTDDPLVFTAPNLDYFFDSPTEISDHEVYQWQAGEGSNRKTFRLALHHAGTPEEGKAFAEMAKAVVEEELAVYAELPPYREDRYTFIACYLPYVNGDGMEHRNSTILTTTRSLERGFTSNIGTVAHEFFHSWNVERMRPRSLEPFNFEGPNVSSELWFAEGFTSYYDDLFLRRAGLISLDSLADRYRGLLDQVIRSPARGLRGPAAMSRQALFHDAASWIDPTNSRNVFISYYTYGSVIGLALDLTLRTQFQNLDLDGFMRAVWQARGRPEKPYDLKDLEGILGQYTGNPEFARDFFGRYIYRGELPPLEKLLESAGLILDQADPSAPWIGSLNLRKRNGHVIVESETIRGEPVYRAGVDRGDEILELGGERINEPQDVAKIVEESRIGDNLEILFLRRGMEVTASLRTEPNPEMELLPQERRRGLSSEQAEFRDRWLGPHSKYRIQTGLYCPVCKRQWPHEYETCPYDGQRLGLTPAPGN